MAYVSMKQMLETGVHFGHQTRRWNPKMRPFIFGARNGIHIIDLQQTVKLYRTAHDKIVETVANGGRVLFIGTKRQAQGSRRPPKPAAPVVPCDQPLDGWHPHQLRHHSEEHRTPQEARSHVRRRFP